MNHILKFDMNIITKIKSCIWKCETTPINYFLHKKNKYIQYIQQKQ